MTRSSTKRVRLWLGVGALLTPAAVLAAAQPSHAALQDGCLYLNGGPMVECTYGLGNSAFVVPNGITSVTITAVGGAGGRGSGGAPGGRAASVTNAFAVAPLDNLLVRVGGKGGNAPTGGPAGGTAGANGGSVGGTSTGGSGGGGGGGGWSGVRNTTTATDLLVAGGGGGGGGAVGVGPNNGGAGGSGADQHSAAGTAGADGSGVVGGVGGLAGPASTPPPTAGGPGVGNTTAGSGGGGGGGTAAGGGGGAGTGTGGGGGGGGGGSFGGASYSTGPSDQAGTVKIRYSACVSHAVVSVGNASVVEGSGAGSTLLNFPITVQNASDCAGVRFRYATADGTAIAPDDYVATSSPPDPIFVIPAGVTRAVVPVTIVRDTVVEPDETFTLTISDLSATANDLTDPTDPVNNLHIGNAIGVGTIRDDDDQIAACDPTAVPPPNYNVIMGDNGPNKIIGTPGNDLIFGLGGDDEILGGQGNDILCGGDGYDEILGGPGNDEISGGAGNDLLIGGAGHDHIVGDGGRNEIHQ
jgi:hypothetical protein